MDRKLIINADGFGFTQGINKGIIESIEKGVVNSISCNVNFPYIQDVEYLVKNYPHVSIGLHFNINVGKPVCPIEDVTTLVDESGEFCYDSLDRRFLLRQINRSELKNELEAQIIKLKSFGVNISHLDSHQHKHLLPGYFGIVLKLGQKYNIKRIRCHRKYFILKDNKYRKLKILHHYLSHPLRIATHIFARIQMKKAELAGFAMADRLIIPIYIEDTNYSISTWFDILRSLPSGSNELYCHPGYPDDILRKYSRYIDERLSERAVLTSNELLLQINKEKIQLISFNQI